MLNSTHILLIYIKMKLYSWITYSCFYHELVFYLLRTFPYKHLQAGKMQQFEQGRFLRDRYREFLTEPFSTERVHVQSTDVDRTIMSAQLTLAGLFPPQGSEVWNRELSWQPVPVHYQPLSQDSVSTTLTHSSRLLYTRPCKG